MVGRIKNEDCRSWVGNDPADVHDNHGHGTNITNLLLEVAPWAEICVGKVFNGNEFCVEEARNVAKAINHAVRIWHADIITMSFGFKRPTPNDTDLKQSIAEIEKEIGEAKKTIFFAAAGNHGAHEPRTFPAWLSDVICIHASDGKGKDGQISPEAQGADDNFMTLGIAIRVIDRDGIPSLKSGTSYAAPIAAALAADILYVTECLIDLTLIARGRLRTGRGMKKMLDLMCMPKGHDGYRFVAPWVQLWRENWHYDLPVIQNAESKILMTDFFQIEVLS
jgi:subtilisin family serine protease